MKFVASAGAGAQGQRAPPGQFPQGQRRGGSPAVKGQRMLAAQRISVEELQETPQFLPGVATRVSAGQFAAEHSRAAPQFQHSRAGQQVERPPAGRVLAK